MVTTMASLMLCVQLMMILIKVSDISNEARPMEVAEPWLDCLLQEFYNQVNQPRNTEHGGNGTPELTHTFSFFCPQSDVEKLEGLPVTPFMDRDKVTKPSSQTGFIRFILLPLFIELANLFPCLEVKCAETRQIFSECTTQGHVSKRVSNWICSSTLSTR